MLAANILNKQSRTENKGWPSSLGVGRGFNNSLTVKKTPVTNNLHKPRTWTDSVDKRPKLRNMVTGLVWLRIGTGGELL
jgi:hypothetical protein